MQRVNTAVQLTGTIGQFSKSSGTNSFNQTIKVKWMQGKNPIQINETWFCIFIKNHKLHQPWSEALENSTKLYVLHVTQIIQILNITFCNVTHAPMLSSPNPIIRRKQGMNVQDGGSRIERAMEEMGGDQPGKVVGRTKEWWWGWR